MPVAFVAVPNPTLTHTIKVLGHTFEIVKVPSVRMWRELKTRREHETPDEMNDRMLLTVLRAWDLTVTPAGSDEPVPLDIDEDNLLDIDEALHTALVTKVSEYYVGLQAEYAAILKPILGGAEDPQTAGTPGKSGLSASRKPSTANRRPSRNGR